MRICILGATGTLGRAVARKLLDATTADLVLSSRHAKETLLPTERITVIDGDATVPEDAEKVVEGADMVFCAISGAELPAAVRTVVEAMKRTGANRLVVTCIFGRLVSWMSRVSLPRGEPSLKGAAESPASPCSATLFAGDSPRL